MKKCGLMFTFAMAMLLAGCGEKNQEDTAMVNPTEAIATVTEAAEPTVEPTATPAPTATNTPTPTPEVDWKNQMLDDALVSTGNNARLKKVLEKAKSGETVNVALLGGSITEGGGASENAKGYAYLFEAAFKETYGN